MIMSTRRTYALSVLASLPLVLSCFGAEIHGSVSPKKTYSIVGGRGVEGKGQEFFIKDNKSSGKLGTIYEGQVDLGLAPTRVIAKWSKDETKLLLVVEFLKTAEVYCVERKNDGKFGVVLCDGISSTAMVADLNSEEFGVKNAEGYRIDGTSCRAGDWSDSTIPVYESVGLIDGDAEQKDFGLSVLIQYSNKGFSISKLTKWGEVSEKRENEILGELKIPQRLD
jgi:hypothetical protein